MSVVMRGAADRGLTYDEAIQELNNFSQWAKDTEQDRKAINAILNPDPYLNNGSKYLPTFTITDLNGLSTTRLMAHVSNIAGYTRDDIETNARGEALRIVNRKIENVIGRTALRYLTGDAVGFAVDGTTPGGSVTLERVYILRGKNAGQTAVFYRRPPSGEGPKGNYHLDGGAGVQLTKYFYSGNINNLDINMFQGESFSFDLGGYNVDLGYSFANVKGGVIQGFMGGASKGSPFGGGLGYEWTDPFGK